jgi:hypothetical protein
MKKSSFDFQNIYGNFAGFPCFGNVFNNGLKGKLNVFIPIVNDILKECNGSLFWRILKVV